MNFKHVLSGSPLFEMVKICIKTLDGNSVCEKNPTKAKQRSKVHQSISNTVAHSSFWVLQEYQLCFKILTPSAIQKSLELSRTLKVSIVVIFSCQFKYHSPGPQFSQHKRKRNALFSIHNYSYTSVSSLLHLQHMYSMIVPMSNIFP